MRPNTYMVVRPKIDPSVFVSDGRLVDQFGNPTSWDEPPGEIVLADWPNTTTTLWATARAYLHEHVIPEGCDPRRTCIGLRSWLFGPLDPQMDVRKITRAHGRLVLQADVDRGMKPGTCRRNMSMGIAALNHAKREERIESVPEFALPKGGASRLRWLTREEVQRLLQVPMAPRIHRFFLLAIHTGVRSQAIIQLTWDRVNFEARTMDFRLPGVNHKNKHRPIAPINDELLPRLRAMYERRKDDYVIGLGPKGKPSCTFRLCKAALAEIGIKEPGVARHVLRHTFCSWRIQLGFSYAHVGGLVGDKAAMIEAVYAHLAPHHLLAASNMDTSILRVGA